MVGYLLKWATCFLLLLCSFSVPGQTFNGQGGLPVPPGAPMETVGITTSEATVSGIGILGNGCTFIDHLTLDFTHTFVGDVAIFLIAPSGEVLELSSSNGGSGNNFQVTVFTDNTSQFITQGAPPYNGTFRPEGRQTNTVPPFPNTNPLGTFTFQNTFDGVNADGVWTLLINDYVIIDVGTLNAWSITFESGGGPPPEVSLGPDITICPGETSTLTADVDPSADSYAWNTGATSSSINVMPSVTTSYSVTVTNGGCTDADTIQVVVSNNSVTADAGPDMSMCAGSSVTLTGSGGGGGATYNWSNGQNGSSITVSPGSTTIYTLTVTEGTCSGTDQVTVTVNPIPVADAGPPISICDGQSATLTATGGSQNNHYLWSTGQTGSTINVSPFSTTTYSVTVTVNGCSDTDDVTVTVNENPTVNAGADVQICDGESTILTATGTGQTYTWSTGQTGSSINVSPTITTTYTVTASDNGCTATDNVTVTVGNITAGITPDEAICEGESITLTASGGSSFEWSTGETGSSITVTPLNTSTYSVTVTQGNCSDEASTTITVNDIPQATISPDEEICQGEIVQLTASGGTTYQWSTGQTGNTISVTPSVTTTYTVTVTDQGCSSSASAEVTVHPTPVASAGSDESICEGEGLTLTASGGIDPDNYVWSTGDNEQSIDVMPGVTTSYSVTVTNDSGCSDEDEVTVQVNPIPIANAGPDIDLCEANVATLTASGGAGPETYEWSTGEDGASIDVSPSVSTTYTVTITVNGCSDEDEVEVTVESAPIADAGDDQEICHGESATLLASGGGDYLWNDGQTSEQITVVPSVNTTYSLTVTSANGCTDIDDVTVIVHTIPAADAGPDQTICEGESAALTGSGGGSYQWSTGEASSDIMVTPASTATYFLTVTDGNGCSATDMVTITVQPLPIANAGANVFITAGESATLTATGGGTYLWSTGETTEMISVMPMITTTYSVTVTINGCSDTDDVTVFVNEAPSVDLGQDVTICEGESITLDAFIPGPFNLQYAWSTGESTDTIVVSPVTTTIYAVTATDINSGISSTDSVTVTVINLPIGNPVISGASDVCPDDTISYSVNPVTGATQYTWSVPAGAIILSGQGTNAISVDWGNSGGGNVEVVAGNLCGALPASILSAIMGSPPVIIGVIDGQTDPCADGNSVYSIDPVTDADNYTWTLTGGAAITSGQGSTSVTIEWNGSAGGTLCLTAGNECGDSNPVCLTIVTTTTPLINAGADTSFCGISGNLAASGSGSWTLVSGPGLANFENDSDPDTEVEVSLPGTYVFSFTISTNGCFATDDVTVIFLDEPGAINISSDCNDVNTSYTVSFQISGGTAPFTINGTPVSGTTFTSLAFNSGDPYSFLIIDANGCMSQDISGINTCLCATSAGSMILAGISVCENEIATGSFQSDEMLDGNDVIAFILHDGNIPNGIIGWNSTPQFSFQPGMLTGVTYFISAIAGDTGTDGFPALSDPCLSVSEGVPVIFNENPVADAGNDAELRCEPEGIALSAEGSSSGSDIAFQWTTQNGQIEGNGSQSGIQVTKEGDYYLEVRNINTGCTSFDTVHVDRISPQPPGITIEAVSPVCFNDCNGTITVNSVLPGALYDLGTGAYVSDGFIGDACSGLYEISVKDTFGCIHDTAVILLNPSELNVDLGPDLFIQAGDSVTIEAITSPEVILFNWTDNLLCQQCNIVSLRPSSSMLLGVEVSDMNGCTAYDELLIEVIQSKDIFVPNVFSPNNDQINDIFFIQGSNDLQMIRNLEIFDRWGNKIFERSELSPDNPSGGWDGTYKGLPVGPGVYVYQFKASFSEGDPVAFSGDITLIR